MGNIQYFSEYYQLLEKTLNETISPQFFYLFLYKSEKNNYILFSPDYIHSEDISFPNQSPFVDLLRKKGKSVALFTEETLPKLSQNDRAKLTLLDIDTCYPYLYTNQLVGFLGIGKPTQKSKYSREDHNFVEEICRFSSLLLHHLIEEEEVNQKLQQMETLNRLAQGINVTLHYDDLLELIYAQSMNVIPLTDFWLTNYDPNNQLFSFAFVVEDGERRFDQENTPLDVNEYLEKLVLQKGKPIKTDDYNQTSRLNGILPKYDAIQSWMSVPLLSGKDLLGTVSVGHRSIEVTYSQKQLQILQAIADQTAAALVKMRLLKTTQTQAHRMTILNEIGRSLTASLELEKILDIVQTQGQKLIPSDEWLALILDESSGEFSQPTPAGLKKIHLDSQIIVSLEKAIQSGEAIIDLREQATDGRETIQTLINPLFIDQRPIGVLLLIRWTTTPLFSQDDKELIKTLGHQVSIALANALKYAQTDQALQLRLNELATLQQIDRELNASLEVERTLTITLQHAIQQSQAKAGVIGLVKDNYFEIVHHFGYESPPASILSLEDLSNGSEINKTTVLDHKLFLEDGEQTILFPLSRENQIIALLILESPQREFCPPETQSFLTRLCSHAGIALSNAILYSEVQQANSAKSEFVSLVSHELKTPMTAIKGYADLIAQGAVGPINEVQANFLSTIRANVNRMANLVSDLADVSRIEAGKLHLEFEATSVQDVLQEVIRTVSTQLEEKKQSIHLDVPDDLPQVWCDRNRLIQIFNNLVSNAIKYSPTESVIEVKCTETSKPSDSQSRQKVVLSSVRDHGVGISAEDQPKIFQKFFRSEDPKVRENPGTGLGLNITKYLVEIQGGQIWFESQLGSGTTFYFTIPVVSAD
ncbi:MAG: GAF domain-containing protein [Anaerolineales bacterium]